MFLYLSFTTRDALLRDPAMGVGGRKLYLIGICEDGCSLPISTMPKAVL